jgi:uncharacterized protein (TIGR03067 family)
MKCRILGLCALLALAASDGRGGDAKKDLEAMEGNWEVTIHEAGGKKTSEEENKKAAPRLEVKGGNYVAFFGGAEATRGSIQLDASKTPKEIDAVDEGAYKGTVLKGIYEIKGDEMRVCFGGQGGDRPKEFKTKEGSQELLLTYKRVKK